MYALCSKYTWRKSVPLLWSAHIEAFHEIEADAATAVSDFLADILDEYMNAAQYDQLSPVTAEKSATRCGWPLKSRNIFFTGRIPVIPGLLLDRCWSSSLPSSMSPSSPWWPTWVWVWSLPQWPLEFTKVCFRLWTRLKMDIPSRLDFSSLSFC